MVGGLAPPPEEEEQERELDAQRQVIFVLESAQLETAQVGKVGACHSSQLPSLAAAAAAAVATVCNPVQDTSASTVGSVEGSAACVQVAERMYRWCRHVRHSGPCRHTSESLLKLAHFSSSASLYTVLCVV
jgi:hypothetical protein